MKLATPATDTTGEQADSAQALPQTLVRIPTEHAPVVQAQAEAAEAAAGEDSVMGG